METPCYGWFGDDFTGATDTLATISERGHRAFLFLDVPDDVRLASVGPLDAVGIASAARSLDSAALAAAVTPAGAFFRKLAVRVLHYKCCSTFDSAPGVGNLATAVAALRPFASHPTVAVFGGQPSLGRYCAFSNLFAAAGSETFRLDRHPTMSRHPATPMGEADLRAHLARLGLEEAVGLHWPHLNDAETLRRAFERPGTVILDALTEQHIRILGALLRGVSEDRTVLALGASSVAEAFFEPRGEPPVEGATDQGPAQVLAFAGSLSGTTRAQILAARRYTLIEADPLALATTEGYREELVSRAVTLLESGANVLLTVVPLAGEAPRAADETLSRRAAALVETILERHPVPRLIAAGGDTSSHLVQALGVWGLAYDGRAAKGVTICRSRSDDPDRDGMELLLKGGQMGDEALFDRFADGRYGVA